MSVGAGERRWGEEQQSAFTQLKQKMAEAGTLSYYEMGLATELVVDASPVGLGAILPQKTQSGDVNVVGYASSHPRQDIARQKGRHSRWCGDVSTSIYTYMVLSSR